MYPLLWDLLFRNIFVRTVHFTHLASLYIILELLFIGFVYTLLNSLMDIKTLNTYRGGPKTNAILVTTLTVLYQVLLFAFTSEIV